jgi:hypothetical protein
MSKYILVAILSLGAAAAIAQAPSAEASASSPAKHSWAAKYKHRKPISPAVNPETSADKKGGA